MVKNTSKPDPKSDDGGGEDEPVSWRDQAVSRSLDSARTRAENRVQRFLDAALELMQDGDSSDFTVQEVVERSGQSLRSFYQYFGGKHELLLALFEEAVRAAAEEVADHVEAESDPVERLHRFVVEYYRICRPVPKGTKRSKKAPAPDPVMVDFAQQLLTAHPAEASRAFAPLVAFLEEILHAAVDSGGLRDDIDVASVAGTVLEVIMFNAFSTTIGGNRVRKDDTAAGEELWTLLFHGMGA